MSESAIWRSSCPLVARVEPARPRAAGRARVARAPRAARDARTAAVRAARGGVRPRRRPDHRSRARRASHRCRRPRSARAGSCRLGSDGPARLRRCGPGAPGRRRRRRSREHGRERAVAVRERRAGWPGSGRSARPRPRSKRSPRRASIATPFSRALMRALSTARRETSTVVRCAPLAAGGDAGEGRSGAQLENAAVDSLRARRARQQPRVRAGTEDPWQDDPSHGERTTHRRATSATAVIAVTAKWARGCGPAGDEPPPRVPGRAPIVTGLPSPCTPALADAAPRAVNPDRRHRRRRGPGARAC